jgi:hypothetical protein
MAQIASFWPKMERSVAQLSHSPQSDGCCRPAGLNSDPARRQSLENRKNLTAPKLLADNDIPDSVDPMNLKKAGSTGRGNTSNLEVFMVTGRQKSQRSRRQKLSSRGRPPVWQREDLCRFWREVAAGLSSEDAAVGAGVSAPVRNRWFRSSGGMPPTHLSPSAISLTSRSLTFREREEIALECAQGGGVRAIAHKLGRSPSTISREIRRNSATRSGAFGYRAITAQWHADRAARRPKAS